MSVVRRIVEGVNYVRNGKRKTWASKSLLRQDRYGANLGLIGLERIGYTVAKKAKEFKV